MGDGHKSEQPRGAAVPAGSVPRDPDERAIKLVALLLAVLVHGAALVVDLPSLRNRDGKTTPEADPVVVRRYVPPPPRIRRPRLARKKEFTRKIPVPDPTPDLPEPIREAEITIEPEPYPADVGALIGEPAPPRGGPPAGRSGDGGSGPFLAGVDATAPIRVPDSYVRPHYPQLARVARVQANVVLQAVIRSDGTVGEIDVLRCSKAGFGFEECAIDAVSQWRYEPARQNGRPVAVYFTIVVHFALV